MSSTLPMKKDELSELFKLASLEKKKKLEEKLKIKHQTKVFEDWLYSDKTKKKQIIDEHVDKNVKKIVNVEPKQDLIEQSLGLLAEPSDVKQVSDPLTPIDQNFATLDDLQNHYKLFLNRIQQQLSTLGGGGAINIKDMEDVDLLTAEVNDKYLKYDSSSKKWVGADTSGGGGSSDKIEEGNTKAEVVDTGSNGHFLVETEGNERARIDASGRMGIGTSLPNSILHLKQTSDAVYMTFDSNSNTPFWVGSTGINTGFFIEQANTNNSILTSDANDYVFLYGAGTKRLETTGIGIAVNGKTDTNLLDVNDRANISDMEVSGISTFAAGVRVTGGINITGVSTFASSIDVNGSANIVGGSTLDQLNVTGVSTFTSTDDTNNAAPIINLYRNSASPADGDYLGQLKFQGESDTGATRNYAKITAKISDASNSNEDGILEFAFLKAGSQNICARFKSTEFMLMNGTNLSVDGNQIDFTNIPTSDPGVAGRLWRDGTDLKISVG